MYILTSQYVHNRHEDLSKSPGGRASCVPKKKEPATHAAELTPHRRRRRIGESRTLERTAYGWMPLDTVMCAERAMRKAMHVDARESK
jgi:hypothetical protein